MVGRNGIDSSTYVTINEVSTVAASCTLAGFIGSNAQIGTSSTNSQGLENAFAYVPNLVDPATGTSPGTASAVPFQNSFLLRPKFSCVCPGFTIPPTGERGRLAYTGWFRNPEEPLQ